MSKRVKDLSGQRAGKLLIESFSGLDDMGRALWECRCDCGNKVVRQAAILSNAIKHGKKSHCGCSPSLKTHGLTKAHKRLHWVWGAMIQRCENPSAKDYPCYGGRGVSVCDSWRNSFAEFVEWALSSGYRDGMTIERVDVNGDYEEKNCTWIPNKRQALNTRRSNIISFNGKSMHISDWAAEVGISSKTIKTRINDLGWSVERALTEAPRKGKNQFG